MLHAFPDATTLTTLGCRFRDPGSRGSLLGLWGPKVTPCFRLLEKLPAGGVMYHSWERSDPVGSSRRPTYALPSVPVLSNWRDASKASICAVMLAMAPVASTWAQTGNDSTNSNYVAPASSGTNTAGDSQPAAPAAAAPAAPASAAPAGASDMAAAASVSATPSASATSPSTTNLSEVTVTGTALSTADAATALPVTNYSAQDLRQQGVTSTRSSFSGRRQQFQLRRRSEYRRRQSPAAPRSPTCAGWARTRR